MLKLYSLYDWQKLMMRVESREGIQLQVLDVSTADLT
jgi:hypothetical protein